MQKQITQFKSIINEFESTFHFDPNCSIQVAKEAVYQCLKWLGQIEDIAKAQQEQKSQEIENQKAEESDVDQCKSCC